ncbi:twin-arginine translocase subunit TatC [Acidaminococcus fermentans]|uniref:Sec-independent protein translocase protein TatC n=1 Tax=Acidaminococcus fermentans TaxID=905 RepID=A0A1H2XJX8_ACIFE|nr:twin-arginine translocase subunit TatC [Acidaminococcus fermentans]MEE0338468.1 twin-arginine translocase subunit TatC [Acidaminococcus fermentans]SDW93117.1 sec-independent protein translocase protein TatC [Acidaminococcus fermentans]
MTWVEHMEELRRRILKSLLAVGIGMVAAFFFMDPIMAFLTRSAGTLYFLKPAEAFMTYFKVLAVVGLLLASPVWFYQLWAFLLPALTQKEKKTLLAFVPFSVLLFVGGCVFAFEIVLPRGLAFFLEFTSPAVQPLLSLESYLDFMVMLVLPFGVLFNLPLALLFLALVGLIRSEQLRKARRFVIFGSFVAAGILTPTTDIVTQCLLAVPLILLYELSYGMIRFGLGR